MSAMSRLDLALAEQTAHYWPPEGSPPSFVSETGADGTWHPVCDRTLPDGEPVHDEDRPVLLRYSPSPMGMWLCMSCGTRRLISDEDWPDAKQDEDEEEETLRLVTV